MPSPDFLCVTILLAEGKRALTFLGTFFVVILPQCNMNNMTLIPALIVTSLISAAHPLHVAYTHIDINNQEKTISVSHKMYTADFTMLFSHLFEKDIEPKDGIEFSNTEVDLINHYMKYRFILVTGNDTLKLDYNSKQQDDESLWLFYSGTLEKMNLNDLTVNNQMLLDLYMDQTNLVIVNNGTIEKGLSFDWENRQMMLVLKE